MTFTPTSQVTLADVKKALTAYVDSDHVNPTTGIGYEPVCVYYSETPSPSGSHRCIAGQVLYDLGVADEIFSMSSSSILVKSIHRGAFAPEDREAIGDLLMAVQCEADGASDEVDVRYTPQPWRLAIERSGVLA